MKFERLRWACHIGRMDNVTVLKKIENSMEEETWEDQGGDVKKKSEETPWCC